TWQAPLLIHESEQDDKQCAAGDGNPTSPFFGNVYAAWDDGRLLRFARSIDHGASWIGIDNEPAGSSILSLPSFAPDLSVAADGTVYIFFLSSILGHEIQGVKSVDGGNSFILLD